MENHNPPAMYSDTYVTEFHCRNCGYTTWGRFEVEVDEEQEEKWHIWKQKHDEMLEEYDIKCAESDRKLNAIEARFSTEVDEHNNNLWKFWRKSNTWKVSRGIHAVSIVWLLSNKIIKRAWKEEVDYPRIPSEPMFEYIECPVCHRKNYIKVY